GVGHSESTPVETALAVDTPISAKRVVEAGSPTPKERTASAVSE
ncbi:MAG: RNA-guided endonuclease TnpB family protein, partial [Halobacteriota archaeon]